MRVPRLEDLEHIVHCRISTHKRQRPDMEGCDGYALRKVMEGQLLDEDDTIQLGPAPTSNTYEKVAKKPLASKGLLANTAPAEILVCSYA